MFYPRNLVAGILFVAAAVSVNAHGWCARVDINGVSYPGWDPTIDGWQNPLPQRIVRSHIPNDSPVDDWNSPLMACNVGGEDPSPYTVPVNAGANVDFIWNTWPQEHMGPMTIYAADCGGSCSTFKASSARWFALDKRGMNDNGVFPTGDFIAAGNKFSTRIPPNMADGEYLIRMNIVALHSDGFPQFYPSCIQVRVQGGGNGRPSENELAPIWELDTGYDNVHIWSPPIPQFRVPGPDVAAFVSGGPSGGQNPPPPPPPPPQNPPPLSTATLRPSSPQVETGVTPTSTQVLGPVVPTIDTKLCKRKVPRNKNKKAKRALNVAYPIPRSVATSLPLAVRHERASVNRRHHDFLY